MLISQRQTGRLIIFTKYPTPGVAKTRLIPAIGAIEAARLQKRMTERISSAARSLAAFHNVSLEIRYTGATRKQFRTWLGNHLMYSEQVGLDLGMAMLEAFASAFKDGKSPVVLVGSDVPALDDDVLISAFESLSQADAVIGPAADGGYYLLGLNIHEPRLFEGITWSSPTVAADTLSRIRACGMSVTLLATLHDIDRPEDLLRLPESWRMGEQ